MTKKQFDRQFILDTADNLFEVYAKNGMLDKPMLRQEYNDTTDSLCKSGVITEYQRQNWVIPAGALNFTYLKGVRNKL